MVMRTKMEGSNIIDQDQIDIENGGENSYLELATSMNKDLDHLSPLSSDCCIYRVPERLRCVDEKMYTPKVVSIGPLHHGNPNLKVMEDHKKRYLRDLLHRTKLRIEVYIKKIKIQEARLRNCYQAEDIAEIDSDKFVTIILVDAAFIIELILRSCGFKKLDKAENDPIFEKPRMINSIVPDMFLLENQLPFFILEDLYVMGRISRLKLTELALEFLTMATDLEEPEKVYMDKISSSSFKVEHFVHLLRTLHLPSSRGRESEDNLGTKSSCRPKLQKVVSLFTTALQSLKKSQTPLTPEAVSTRSITYLHRAGVNFTAESRKNLFDIQFKKHGILKIPKIKIHDHTELILRNLIAFEQCHCVYPYLGEYVYMLDQLVNTTEDVELLVQDKVVENMLGDNKQVCDMINRLCIGVTVNKYFYFNTLCGELNKYCGKRRHRWMATLRQDYFNTPWALVSFVAALVLLVLTVISTVCSFDIC